MQMSKLKRKSKTDVTLHHTIDTKNLPQLDASAVKIVLHIDYYDGPYSGVLSYMGSYYYFYVCYRHNYPPKALVYNLSAIETIMFHKQLLRDKLWWKLHSENASGLSKRRPLGLNRVYKDLARSIDRGGSFDKDISKSRPVGWFYT